MTKIILNRKGYDDQYGGKPSVIMPDGAMVSFPIPVKDEKGTSTSKLFFDGQSLTSIFDQLGHKETSLNHHVDPDIYHFERKNLSGSFGQAGAALGHLNNQKVGKGDIFLFFGSFCPTVLVRNTLKYEMAHSFHAIFGYLIVDRLVSIEEIENEESLFWLKSHPHYANRNVGDYAKANSIYVGSDYGYFRFNECLRLSKQGYKKSYWQLPNAFKDISITYHENVERRLFNDKIEFMSVAKGQEFVFDREEKLEGWLECILKQKINV